MKKNFTIVMAFVLLFNVLCVSVSFAATVYTVNVAVYHDNTVEVPYAGLEDMPYNITMDKLENMGCNCYREVYDEELGTEVITAVFYEPVDENKVKEHLERIPGFEVRDSKGNVLMDESHLSHVGIYTRCLWDEYDKKLYRTDIDDEGQKILREITERPAVDSMLEFIFNDEGKVRFQEVLKELAGRAEGDNRYYVYVNEKFVVSYKAKEDLFAEYIVYIGENEEEHYDLHFEVGAKGEFLMPSKTEILSIGDSYEINCSPWALHYVLNMWTNNFIDLDEEKDYTKPITREEFCIYAAKVINLFGDTEPENYKSKFKDTDSHEVAMLNELGIINGKGNGLFAPEDYITREEASAILCRMLGHLTDVEVKADTDYRFADDDEISSWAKETVYAAYSENIMTGVGGDMFNPGGTFTAEQAFVTFLRIIEVKLDFIIEREAEL